MRDVAEEWVDDVVEERADAGTSWAAVRWDNDPLDDNECGDRQAGAGDIWRIVCGSGTVEERTKALTECLRPMDEQSLLAIAKPVLEMIHGQKCLMHFGCMHHKALWPYYGLLDAYEIIAAYYGDLLIEATYRNLLAEHRQELRSLAMDLQNET